MAMTVDHFATQVSTTNATPLNVAAAASTIGDGFEAIFELHVIAKSGVNVKGFKAWGAAKCAIGGAVTIVGTVQSMITAQGDAALATALASVVANGNTVVPQLTGIAATTITWDVHFEVHRTR